MILVPLIMAFSLIGTVLLIGVCAPISAATVPTAPPRVDPPAIVMEEPLREDRSDRDLGAAREDGAPRESVSGESSEENAEEDAGKGAVSAAKEDAIKTDLREWIARSSVPTLRARGMTDEEIKSELLRDFSLTEERVDEILAAR